MQNLKSPSALKTPSTPSTLRDLKQKISQINLDIQTSRDKMNSIANKTFKDHTTEREAFAEYSDRKQTHLLNRSFQPILDTTNRLVNQKKLELMLAQQQAEEAAHDLEKLSLEEKSLADKKINQAIEDYERTKLQLRKDYDDQLLCLDKEFEQKIKSIKAELEKNVERKLKTYQEQLLSNENTGVDIREDLQVRNFSVLKERDWNLRTNGAGSNNKYQRAEERKPIYFPSDIENRLLYIRKTIDDYKTQIENEKDIKAFMRKQTQKFDNNKFNIDASTKKGSIRVTRVDDSSSEEDNNDFEKYLMLKRKIRDKKVFTDQHKKNKKILQKLL